MKLAFRLHQIVEKYLNSKGFIGRFAEAAGVERHKLSSILKNEATQVTLNDLAGITAHLISDYLTELNALKIAPADLPGALFEPVPEKFWDMLAGCDRIQFYLGKRRHPKWPGSDYVSAVDNHMMGLLLSIVSKYDDLRTMSAPKRNGAKVERPAIPGPHVFSLPQMVSAPAWNEGNEPKGSREKRNVATQPLWNDVCDEAENAYKYNEQQSGHYARIALGSVKVDPVVELMFADCFSATAWQTVDRTANKPSERRCPIMFRYRQADPKPKSCCGGMQLAKRVPAPQCGIYYEHDGDDWRCCPCDTSHDAAFVLYVHRPQTHKVDLACGGFSSMATSLLTSSFETIASQLWPPQIASKEVEVGLFVVTFQFEPLTKEQIDKRYIPECQTEVIPVPADAVQRRLNQTQSGTESGSNDGVAAGE